MAFAGKHSVVRLGANDVLAINDATFTINGEVLEITDFLSGGWRERLASLIDASIDISGYYDPSDSTGQVAFRDAVLNQNSVADVTVLADSTDSTSGFTCDAFVESFEMTTTVDGAVEVSISLVSHGQVSAST